MVTGRFYNIKELQVSQLIFESHKKMADLRDLRRRRLCEALTYVGCFFLLVFGTLALVNGELILSGVLLLSMSIGLINVGLLHLHLPIEICIAVLNALIFILCLVLLITGGSEGTGILWIYPLVAINLFLNNFRPALLLYGTFLLISGILLFTPLKQTFDISLTNTESIRFEFTLLALWLICLTAIRFEEMTFEAALKLHDNDVFQLAYEDSLTGLPNRRAVLNHLEQPALYQYQDKANTAIMFLDLDRFKTINDSLGHRIGDALLQQVAKRIKETVREKEIAARLGGDEFLIIATDLSPNREAAKQELAKLAQRITDKLSQPTKVEGMKLMTSASIGITFLPPYRFEAEVAIQEADIAMFQAKKNGKNQHRFYHDGLQKLASERLHVEKTLHEMLSNFQLKPCYQPQVFVNGEVFSIQASPDWQSTVLNQLPASRINQIADECGLSHTLDLWLIRESCLQIKQWEKENPSKDLRIAVKICTRHLYSSTLFSDIDVILTETGVNISLIELEISESLHPDKLSSIIPQMEKLKQRGLRFALRNFGSGYSSLRYLKEMPLDVIKIDPAFIKCDSSDRSIDTILQAMITLSQSFEIDVIASGISTESQKDQLIRLGCSLFQGDYFAKPQSADEITTLLASRDRLPLSSYDPA